MAQEKTDFENGFEIILKTFQKYANSDNGGCSDKLEKAEMKALLKEQFRGYLTVGEKTSVDDIFQKFDEDNSDSVDFVEFIKIVAHIAADSDILKKVAEGKSS